MSLLLAREHAQNVDSIATVAMAQTVAVMNELEGETVPRTAYVLREVLPGITETLGVATGTLSVNYYEELRASSAATTSYDPVVRNNQVGEIVEKSIGFSMAQLTKGIAYATVIDTLAGNVQRAVAGVDRETLYFNIAVDPDGTRYQRVPTANACAFCRTMAAVARETEDEISHFHSFCRCASIPVFKGQEPIELPEYKQIREAYALANKELDRQRAEVNYIGLRKRDAMKLYPDLAITTQNQLRLMRQITGWR